MALIAGGAVYAYTRQTPANEIAWATDLATARAMAAESGKPVLMEFTATWCPACKAVKRNVWPDKRVEHFVNARVIPLSVDVDSQRELSAEYRINPIPAFILTDSTGRELARAEGYLDADQMMSLIESGQRKLVSVVPPVAPLPPGHRAEEN